MTSETQAKLFASKKSFVNRLADSVGKSSVSTFSAFPKKVSFNGQDKNESIILIVRQHPIVYILRYFLVVLMIIFAFVVSGLFGSLGLEGAQKAALSLGSFVFFILAAIVIAYDTFIRWFYSVNIITDQRIVDVDFLNILHHNFSEAQLERIEDVSHSVSGIFGSMFDYGTVKVQTAGAKNEFEFNNVPRPRDVQDTLFDLLELKQHDEL